MPMQLQPVLFNDIVRLEPLTNENLESLFLVASDPLIWEQHPNKNRFQRSVFENFFAGAIQSGGAFLIKDPFNDSVIGSSRYYDYNETASSVFIGYTFLARQYWGKNFNASIKKLMLDYAFQYVDTVLFHIGAENIRSQIAMQRLGGIKLRELIVAYHGEPDRLNFEYAIEKGDWVG